MPMPIKKKTSTNVLAKSVAKRAGKPAAKASVKAAVPFPAIEPGTVIAPFTLPDQTGTARTLASLLAGAHRGTKGGPLVLYCYPEADTPACTQQACELNADLAALAKLGATVAAISPDEPAKLRAFADKFKLTFPLLGDVPDSSGVPRVMKALRGFGTKNLYGKMVTGVIRSTLFIARDGTVIEHWPKTPAKGHAGRVVRALERIAAKPRQLSARDSKMFMDLVGADAEPNAALKEAANRVSRRRQL